MKIQDGRRGDDFLNFRQLGMYLFCFVIKTSQQSNYQNDMC